MRLTKDAVVDTLTRLAAGRGTLSAQELRQVVPVEAMSVEDVAALIAELEDRGVAVEIDPGLLTPRHPLSPEARAAATIRPGAGTPPPAPPARPAAAMPGSAAGPPPASAPPGTTRPSSQGAVAIAVLAAALVVVVLATLVWAF